LHNNALIIKGINRSEFRLPTFSNPTVVLKRTDK